MTWGIFLLLFVMGGVVLAGLGRLVWLAERQRQARALAARPTDPENGPDAP